jgi:60 kDa SS-A/Ro ribonucleoprotein
MDYSKHVSTKRTSQTKPIPGKAMVKNNAGGFTFSASERAQLNRFLILGSEGGTYYVGEQKLTEDNAKNVIACIQKAGLMTVADIVAVSQEGRAPKNDPAIFALALACTYGDEQTKIAAYGAITAVCRTGTHLFTFCQAVQNLRGWSRGLRNGVARFYTERSFASLALQLMKYRQRNGWTHRDVMRLAHPTPLDAEQNALFSWAVGKATEGTVLSEQLCAFQELQNIAGAKRAAKLITDYQLPWEAVPTQLLNSPEVWAALLPSMGLTAMIRNLGKMTSIGLLKSNLDSTVKTIAQKLTNPTELKKARIHPLNALIAQRTYNQGHGEKGSLSWSPVGALTDALESAFHLSFNTVEATGKNHLLALDVSGSMSSRMNNLPISYCEAAAAMAMVAVRSEPYTEVRGFSSTFKKLGITAKDNLETAARKAHDFNFGSTDCSLPMVAAKQEKLEVDAFVVYTDNETYAGRQHPCQALKAYRQASGRNAKLIVVGMAANPFTIADPNDAGSLDVVGFDTSVPAVMADFVR